MFSNDGFNFSRVWISAPVTALDNRVIRSDFRFPLPANGTSRLFKKIAINHAGRMHPAGILRAE